MSTTDVCGLCGHECARDLSSTCGFATADGVRLCHASSHSCYRRWTVYGERPVHAVEERLTMLEREVKAQAAVLLRISESVAKGSELIARGADLTAQLARSAPRK